MYKKKKTLLIFIVLLVIGFATLSATLTLNGLIGIGTNEDDFKIIFTSAKLNGMKKPNFISEDKKTITFVSNELKNVDDKAILTYEVTNASRNYDSDVSVTCTAGNNEYIMFEYTPHQMEVLAGETKSGTLTASMLKVVDKPTDVPITCTLNGTPKEKIELASEYIPPFSKSGVMKEATNSGASPAGMWSYRSNINRVIFEDELNPHDTTEELTFDISDKQDGSVMAYLIPNGESLTILKDGYTNRELEDTTAYTLYIQGDTGIIANPNSGNLFAYFNNILEITNIKYLDTSQVRLMGYMFYRCKSLTKLDVSNFDTSNVTYMNSIFSDCSSLTELNLSSFDTSKVESFHEIFRGCENLRTLDISSFNTSSITDMERMFYDCRNLTILDLRNFDTSNVTNMYETFGDCSNLTSLDLSSFNTSKVKNMSGMFYYCRSLKSLDVSSFDTSNVTVMNSYISSHSSYRYNGMFSYCSSLEELDLSNFDISKVTSLTNMFEYCGKLKKINLSSFNTSNITEVAGMFDSCFELSTIKLSNFDTSNVTTMYSMFSYCSNLTNLDITNFDTSKVTDMNAMFYQCRSLTELDLSHFNTSNVTDMQGMFYNCAKLNATITIRGTKCTKYTNHGIFENAATEVGSEIIVNYTDDASDLVDSMIETKSATSNVRKGNNISGL